MGFYFILLLLLMLLLIRVVLTYSSPCRAFMPINHINGKG